MEKICTKCKTQKPLTEFHRSSSQWDGLRYTCKSCDLQHQRETNLKIECECGKIVGSFYIKQHRKREIHRLYLEFKKPQKSVATEILTV